ncbi:MAG TPA: ABC transporter substrate-binding protein [Acidimicrobiales bacterium]|nr:ABC transporter substrate-binding protein [Acidimicrobiales bacterium]
MPTLSPDRWFRPLAIATASLLITSLISVGGVKPQSGPDNGHLVAAGKAGHGATDTTASVDTTTTTAAGAGAVAGGSGGGGAGTTARGGAGTAAGSGSGGGAGGSGGTGKIPASAVPDFGLKTQGVTDKEVKIGYSYNVSACGDAGTLQAMFGSATTGDPKKALDAYTRYINDSGGIAGRTLKVAVVDDGGDGCPEKNAAAAVKMADEEKVFMAIPGLHVESDYLIGKKIPVFGGRDDPASLAKAGPNGIMLTEAIEPTLEKWAAFGKNYLDSGAHTPCLIHPESGASGDWNNHEKIIVNKMAKYGLHFKDIVVYQEDVSTAQRQANTAAARLKAKGCDQVYFMAGNPIAMVFFTQAATQNVWFPTWTFTSYMVLADTELAGRLMDQRQWDNAIGLSTRVPPGNHRMEGNCKRIYQKYYGNDDQSDSAYTQVVCAQLLSVAEIMRRAVARTGVLTGNSLIVGADSVRNDFFYDATVPLRWSMPSPAGPFKTKAFSHYTVVKWSSADSKYLFPEFPTYWEVMGPGKSGGQDMRSYFK